MSKVDYSKISGEAYDWRKTGEPERPYIHDYSKALTYKMFMAVKKNNGTETVVKHTFSEALEVIKKIDAMTLGMPKIVYLVGWQFFGHDSKYPSWDGVNDALKRPEDENARDSLIWLMDEGFKYNTTVSLHINIQDAYEDSPLWDTYVENDLITKNADGSLCKGGIWGGQQCYIVSYAQEWNKGFLQKRIDELCDFLPIQRAGTIHIDAMHARADVGHGLKIWDIQAIRNKVVRYWRELGVDVTTEFLYYETYDWNHDEHLVGLMPCAYHFSQSLEDYMARDARVICGVNVARTFKEGVSDSMDKLFGASFPLESMLGVDGWENVVFENVYKKEFKYKYLNSLRREKAIVERDTMSACFSDGVITHLDGSMEKNGVLIQNESFGMYPISHIDGAYLIYADGAFEVQIDVATAFGIADGELFLQRFTPEGIADDGVTARVESGVMSLSFAEKSAFFLKL